MDHMDGIESLFAKKTVHNFWDCGVRKDKPDFKGSPYRESDWDFYENLISGNVSGPNLIHPRAGSTGKYYNADNDEGQGSGDFISVISPDEDLIDSANSSGDVNDASYVIVYRHNAGNIIFPGDSNDKTWEYILNNSRSKKLVENAAVLFAPHHGRKSDRDYGFLDVVRPRVSFFGCAPSESLAYSAWSYRELLYFTNNQCGNIHLYPEGSKVKVFIQNKTYADNYSDQTYQRDNFWHLCDV